MIATLRAALILAAFFVLTLPLMPLQAVLLRVPGNRPRPAMRHFPHWYHRQLCRLLGVRLHIDGALEPGVPTLLLANHVSWLDIPVLSAVAPVAWGGGASATSNGGSNVGIFTAPPPSLNTSNRPWFPRA